MALHLFECECMRAYVRVRVCYHFILILISWPIIEGQTGRIPPRLLFFRFRLLSCPKVFRKVSRLFRSHAFAEGNVGRSSELLALYKSLSLRAGVMYLQCFGRSLCREPRLSTAS